MRKKTFSEQQSMSTKRLFLLSLDRAFQMEGHFEYQRLQTFTFVFA